jgi:hypothetical protein
LLGKIQSGAAGTCIPGDSASLLAIKWEDILDFSGRTKGNPSDSIMVAIDSSKITADFNLTIVETPFSPSTPPDTLPKDTVRFTQGRFVIYR